MVKVTASKQGDSYVAVNTGAMHTALTVPITLAPAEGNSMKYAIKQSNGITASGTAAKGNR